MGQKAQGRTWRVEADEFGSVDPAVLQDAFAECAAITHRLGGAFVIAAARREVEPGVWVTEQVVFRWESFVPAVRRDPDPEPEVAEPEEPVLAEAG